MTTSKFLKFTFFACAIGMLGLFTSCSEDLAQDESLAIDMEALNAEMDAIFTDNPADGVEIVGQAHSTGCTLLAASGRVRNLTSSLTNVAYRYTPGNTRLSKFVIVYNGDVYKGVLTSGNGGDEAHDLSGNVTTINRTPVSGQSILIHADDIRQISMNVSYFYFSTSGASAFGYFAPSKGQIRNVVTDCGEEG